MRLLGQALRAAAWTLWSYLPITLSTSSAVTLDPEQIAQTIWAKAPANAVIHVTAKEDSGPDQDTHYGTAFMISDAIALSAGHVLCKSDREARARIELRFGGPGVPSISPLEGVDCWPDGIDIAVFRVPGLNTPRPHFEPGAVEDTQFTHFITVFGYPGNQPGRYLKGTARFPVDNLSRLRTDGLSAGPGDSGAPVLDRTGRVIGVLTAGYENTIAIVPLRLIGDRLKNLSIFVPDPVARPPDITPSPPQSTTPSSVQGSVRVTLGRLPNGNWPVPRTRLAGREEAQVLFTVQSLREDAQAYTNWTNDQGAWSAPVSSAGNAALQFSAIATHADDLERAPEEYAFRAEPVYGRLSGPTVSLVALELYARSAYVATKFALAKDKMAMLWNSPDWLNCKDAFAVTSKPNSSCSTAKLSSVKRAIANVDQDFLRALDASTSESSDVTISTVIANAWSTFFIQTNRPCRAAAVLSEFFERQSANVRPPLFAQMVSSAVNCQSLQDNAPGAQMPWREDGETRQMATVRLIVGGIDKYFPDSATLKPVKMTILKDATTAFEMYRPGVVQVKEAAAVIAASPQLTGSLKQFTSKFVSVACGRRVSTPRDDAKSIEQTLSILRSFAGNCGAG